MKNSFNKFKDVCELKRSSLVQIAGGTNTSSSLDTGYVDEKRGAICDTTTSVTLDNKDGTSNTTIQTCEWSCDVG